MKILLPILLFTITCTGTQAQSTAGLGATANSQNVYLNNLTGKAVSPLERDNISGSPYLTTDFRKATVVLTDGRSFRDVPVKINTFNNEVIFLKYNHELALESAKTITYLDNRYDSSSFKVFNSGYPAHGAQTTATFYQVLGGGDKAQLLKHTYSKLEPKKTMGYFHLKEFITYHAYYVYTPAGIEKVTLNAAAIMKALPQLRGQIEKIVADKKLNLRREEDAAALFNSL